MRRVSSFSDVEADVLGSSPQSTTTMSDEIRRLQRELSEEKTRAAEKVAAAEEMFRRERGARVAALREARASELRAEKAEKELRKLSG